MAILFAPWPFSSATWWIRTLIHLPRRLCKVVAHCALLLNLLLFGLLFPLFCPARRLPTPAILQSIKVASRILRPRNFRRALAPALTQEKPLLFPFITPSSYKQSPSNVLLHPSRARSGNISDGDQGTKRDRKTSQIGEISTNLPPLLSRPPFCGHVPVAACLKHTTVPASDPDEPFVGYLPTRSSSQISWRVSG